MAQASAAAEPSMEEILASIRRIISDENEEGAGDETEAKAAPSGSAPEAVAEEAPQAPEPMKSEEELDKELQDLLPAAQAQEETKAAQPEVPAEIAETPASAPVIEAEPLELDAQEDVSPIEPDDATVEEAAVEPEPLVLDEPLTLDTPVDDDPLELTDEIVEQAVTEFSNASEGLVEPETGFAVAAEFRNLERMLAAENMTMEELTNSVVRPMVKTWLDDNLPQLVERLVREEIQRVARG